MEKNRKLSRSAVIFIVLFIFIAAVFAAAVIKTDAYNRAEHKAVFSGDSLFGEGGPTEGDVTVYASPRSSVWTKVFDLKNEGLEEHTHQAYTYDFSVTNNTGDEVSSFKFVLTFDKETFLLSAWNGALELHQFRDNEETVETVPDLREFHSEDYSLDTVTVDGEVLVRMMPGDKLVYYPSSDVNAMEVPLEPYKGTVPGVILYVAIGEDISGSTLELDYTFHRLIKSEPLFWISLAGFAIWLVSLVTFFITSAQIRKYNERHERDNEIIRESMETFTGFIDAKDPYTNGHSKRVAYYTRLIAGEMGYEGEELDRIYYVALLHDCGKIGVPDNILRKPGKLTDEEFEVIKSHTVRGGEILSSFRSLKNAGEGALFHHERYDGRGYPEGKKGDDIPFIARVICVADSFDAMNSNRVYRKKLSKEDILNEIINNKGKQFDPNVADVFLRLLEDEGIWNPDSITQG